MSEGATGAETGATSVTPGTEAESAAETTPAAGAGWRDGFSEDLKGHPGLEKFQNSEALAKSYLELESAYSKRQGIPGADDPPEVWKQFYISAGCPETADGYDFNGFEVPALLADIWDGDLQSGMVEDMHALGVSQKQARGIIEAFAKRQETQYQGVLKTLEENRAETREALKKEWGMAHAAKMESAKRGILRAAEALKMDPTELAGQATHDGGIVGDSVAMTKLFAMLGEASGEAPMLGDKGSGGSLTKTPDEARIELESLSKNPALYDRDHPDHARLLERQTALYKQMYPEEEKT